VELVGIEESADNKSFKVISVFVPVLTLYYIYLEVVES
jgi:hypothetical protein